MKRAQAQGPAVSEPYTITQIQYSTNSETGNSRDTNVVMSRSVIAQDGAGNSVRKVHDEHYNFDYRHIYMANGIERDIYELPRTVSTVKHTISEIAAHRAARPDPDSGCLKQFSGAPSMGDGIQDDGTDTVLGVSVKLLRMNEPNGSFWIHQVAPSLGCLNLGSRFSEHSGKLMASTVTTNIQRGEPDAALFAVDSTYRETGYYDATESNLRMLAARGQRESAGYSDQRLADAMKNKDATIYNTHRP
jgi:hypothetical protein